MPPIEFDGAKGLPPVRKLSLNPVQPTSSALRGAEAQAARAVQPPKGEQAAQPETVQIDASLFEAGQPSVDAERVAQIRKAVESGTYPLLPTRVADAMIAAGMLLAKGGQN